MRKQLIDTSIVKISLFENIEQKKCFLHEYKSPLFPKNPHQADKSTPAFICNSIVDGTPAKSRDKPRLKTFNFVLSASIFLYNVS